MRRYGGNDKRVTVEGRKPGLSAKLTPTKYKQVTIRFKNRWREDVVIDPENLTENVIDQGTEEGIIYEVDLPLPATLRFEDGTGRDDVLIPSGDIYILGPYEPPVSEFYNHAMGSLTSGIWASIDGQAYELVTGIDFVNEQTGVGGAGIVYNGIAMIGTEGGIKVSTNGKDYTQGFDNGLWFFNCVAKLDGTGVYFRALNGEVYETADGINATLVASGANWNLNAGVNEYWYSKNDGFIYYGTDISTVASWPSFALPTLTEGGQFPGCAPDAGIYLCGGYQGHYAYTSNKSTWTYHQTETFIPETPIPGTVYSFCENDNFVFIGGDLYYSLLDKAASLAATNKGYLENSGKHYFPKFLANDSNELIWNEGATYFGYASDITNETTGSVAYNHGQGNISEVRLF